MPNISTVTVNNVDYNLQDAGIQTTIGNLSNSVNDLSGRITTVENNSSSEVMKDLAFNNWTISAIQRVNSNSDVGYVAWSPELALFCFVYRFGTNTDAIYTSSDGINWTARTYSGGNYRWEHIVWNSNIGCFVIVGSDNSNQNILSSFDGINWHSRVNPTNSAQGNLMNTKDGKICCFSNTYNSTTMERLLHKLTTTDGINFTSETSVVPIASDGTTNNSTLSIAGIEQSIDTGTYIMTLGGYQYYDAVTRIYRSTDGRNWLPVTNVPSSMVGPQGGYVDSPVYHPKLKIFVATGQNYTGTAGTTYRYIYSSTDDGKSWNTIVKSQNSVAIRNICYLPGFDVLVGRHNDTYFSGILFSKDAINWFYNQMNPSPLIGVNKYSCAWSDSLKIAVAPALHSNSSSTNFSAPAHTTPLSGSI